MNIRKFLWILAAVFPGSIPAFLGVSILMGEAALPVILGWVLISQSAIFLWLCAGEAVSPKEKAIGKVAELKTALRLLVDASEVYSADQSKATDSRCGVTQPVTVEEANDLNEALQVAYKHLRSGGSSRE